MSSYSKRMMARYWKVISVSFELILGACVSGLLTVITVLVSCHSVRVVLGYCTVIAVSLSCHLVYLSGLVEVINVSCQLSFLRALAR